MAYSAMQVANALIRRSQDGEIVNLTPMKLQKLMFFAQSWYLRLNGRRLINDEFVRWQYGPVVQSVYYEFAKNRGTEIKYMAKNAQGKNFDSHLDIHDEAFMNELIKAYGGYTGWQLSDMTHAEGGAWSMGGMGSVITDREMLNGKV